MRCHYTTQETVTSFGRSSKSCGFCCIIVIFTITLHVRQLEKLPERQETLGFDHTFRILCLGCWRVNSRYIKGSGFA